MQCSSDASRIRLKHKCAICDNVTTNPKFCSNSCAATHINSVAPKRIKQIKTCVTCGTICSTKYCSTICNPRRLNMTPEEKQIYIRAKKNEAWARYMCKKKNQTPIDADIPAMQLFYINCPVGYEVDHVVPISKGGLHSLENLQYLTISENRKKSNKV